MRYRNSIKICNGVKINLSKTGPSLTIGGKGASLNFGSKGTYLNTGIPGTGFYNRQKIEGETQHKSVTSRSRNSNYVVPSQYDFSGEVKVRSHDDGRVDIFDAGGRLITDPTVLKAIKAQDGYKPLIMKLSNQRLQEIKEEGKLYTEVYKKSISVKKIETYRAYIDHISPQKYNCTEYTVKSPTDEYVDEWLTEKASVEINTKKFWKRGQLIKEFVESNRDITKEKFIKEWQIEKAAFEQSERKKEIEMNAEYQKEYLEKKNHLLNLINNDKSAVEESVKNLFEQISFPFEFNVDFDIKDSKLLIDLDLPEIENMPMKVAKVMANGTIKIKDKAVKDLKIDYYNCVLGIAVCFATYLFDCAIGAEEIIVSAYTQRRNSQGAVCDDYIYSIKFPREKMAETDLKKSLEEIFFSFENICRVKQDKSFKTISPFEL